MSARLQIHSDSTHDAPIACNARATGRRKSKQRNGAFWSSAEFATAR